MQGVTALPSKFQLEDLVEFRTTKVIGVVFTEEGVYYDIEVTLKKGLNEEDTMLDIFYSIPESALK